MPKDELEGKYNQLFWFTFKFDTFAYAKGSASINQKFLAYFILISLLDTHFHMKMRGLSKSYMLLLTNFIIEQCLVKLLTRSFVTNW